MKYIDLSMRINAIENQIERAENKNQSLHSSLCALEEAISRLQNNLSADIGYLKSRVYALERKR